MSNPHVEGRRQEMLVLEGSKKEQVDIRKATLPGLLELGEELEQVDRALRDQRFLGHF